MVRCFCAKNSPLANTHRPHTLEGHNQGHVSMRLYGACTRQRLHNIWDVPNSILPYIQHEWLRTRCPGTLPIAVGVRNDLLGQAVPSVHKWH